jgi:lantibiotic modifying enzyme
MPGDDSLLSARDAPLVSTSGASWRPLLSGAERDSALEAVDGLVASLAAADPDGDPSLSAGSAGLSVLFAQLARVGGKEHPRAVATRFLDDAIDVLSAAPLGPSLYAGFTGIAWAAELVGRLLDGHDEDPNEGIDDALLGLLARANWDNRSYDLIYGLTGLGVYAMERWPRPVAADSVAAVVDHLTRRARHDEHGTYWWTGPSLLLGPRREQYPAGGVDLGVAHGIAGVIPFLACARALGLAGTEADALLEGAVGWLLAHTVETEAGPTIPYFIADGTAPGPARSAWCYGDPGVAAALLVAGHEAQKPAWTQTATRLARRAAERPIAHTGVVDAGFCHGSAGLAHLFNRMHQMTGDQTLCEAARFWVDQTLDRCEASRRASSAGAAGDAPAPQPPWNRPGVLEGAAGVALVLLAASTPVEPVWDRMFLISPLGPRTEAVDAQSRHGR